MKSVFPPDTHRLRDFYRTQNEVAVNVQSQRIQAEDTDSNEIDLTPNKPPMTVALYKFRWKLGSLWRPGFEFLGTLATITTDSGSLGPSWDSEFWDDPADTRGYILKFRCVYCGSHEVSVEYPCEAVVPMDEIKSRIYEANCKACGWKGKVCGVSAVQISYSLGLETKVRGKGQSGV